MSDFDAAWQPVTCRSCKRSYQCTPEDDYYGGDSELAELAAFLEPSPHLNVGQAIAVRDALDAFIREHRPPLTVASVDPGAMEAFGQAIDQLAEEEARDGQ